ncbi:TetR/AcrR family transcriptional regulator [Gordonia bronchialis]|uniref:TetR/AcrR family transcriptional regulator n=1 Tax=Gordonia bronchialis TaxID=2054 RepID=UPI001CBAC90E|nr:TetR/AcrR family transcriptional regulator [Gordonia bronchialis]UAK39389.1 TetR/AcrR family transcriptional regulator [Gordonia bronchialis]
MAPRTQRSPVAAKNGTAKSSSTRSEASAPKSERTRERILDAAAQVLSRKGYAGLRLTDVAEVAELQAPAIYYYFDSRDTLVEEVMWFGLADMRQHLVAALDALPDGTDPLDRILVAVEAHLRHELEISAYTTASIRNAGQLPEKIGKRQAAEEAKYGKVWKSLIVSAYEEGAIRQDLDLYMLQMLVLGSLNWAAEWWTPRRGNLDKVVANAQAFLRQAIAPGASTYSATPEALSLSSASSQRTRARRSR